MKQAKQYTNKYFESLKHQEKIDVRYYDKEIHGKVNPSEWCQEADAIGLVSFIPHDNCSWRSDSRFIFSDLFTYARWQNISIEEAMIYRFYIEDEKNQSSYMLIIDQHNAVDFWKTNTHLLERIWMLKEPELKDCKVENFPIETIYDVILLTFTFCEATIYTMRSGAIRFYKNLLSKKLEPMTKHTIESLYNSVSKLHNREQTRIRNTNSSSGIVGTGK